MSRNVTDRDTCVGSDPDLVSCYAARFHMLTVLAAGAFALTSTAFANNANIPSKFTCDAGQTNPSPALAWTDAPAGTKSFALIMHAPDAPLAGGFTHWGLFDVP